MKLYSTLDILLCLVYLVAASTAIWGAATEYGVFTPETALVIMLVSGITWILLMCMRMLHFVRNSTSGISIQIADSVKKLLSIFRQ